MKHGGCSKRITGGVVYKNVKDGLLKTQCRKSVRVDYGGRGNETENGRFWSQLKGIRFQLAGGKVTGW